MPEEETETETERQSEVEAERQRQRDRQRQRGREAERQRGREEQRQTHRYADTHMHTHREGTPGGSCRTSSGRDCGSGTRSERPTKREPVTTTDVVTLVRGYPGALNDVPYVLRNG